MIDCFVIVLTFRGTNLVLLYLSTNYVFQATDAFTDEWGRWADIRTFNGKLNLSDIYSDAKYTQFRHFPTEFRLGHKRSRSFNASFLKLSLDILNKFPKYSYERWFVFRKIWFHDYMRRFCYFSLAYFFFKQHSCLGVRPQIINFWINCIAVFQDIYIYLRYIRFCEFWCYFIENVDQKLIWKILYANLCKNGSTWYNLVPKWTLLKVTDPSKYTYIFFRKPILTLLHRKCRSKDDFVR